MIGGSGLGKTNACFKCNKQLVLIKYIYMQKVHMKHYVDLKVFIEYSNDMQDVHKNIEEYNLGKKHKVLNF